MDVVVGMFRDIGGLELRTFGGDRDVSACTFVVLVHFVRAHPARAGVRVAGFGFVVVPDGIRSRPSCVEVTGVREIVGRDVVQA